MNKKNTHTTSVRRRANAQKRVIEYVFPIGAEGWVVKNSGSTAFTLITDSKQEAVSMAREIAKKLQIELIVHNRNGQIEKQESYVA